MWDKSDLTIFPHIWKCSLSWDESCLTHKHGPGYSMWDTSDMTHVTIHCTFTCENTSHDLCVPHRMSIYMSSVWDMTHVTIHCTFICENRSHVLCVPHRIFRSISSAWDTTHVTIHSTFIVYVYMCGTWLMSGVYCNSTHELPAWPQFGLFLYIRVWNRSFICTWIDPVMLRVELQ